MIPRCLDQRRWEDKGGEADERGSHANGGGSLDRVCKSGNIDARLAAVSRGLAIGSLYTNRNICSTIRSLANFHSFQHTSNNQPLLFRQRERERERMHLLLSQLLEKRARAYVARLSLIEALKASLCSDRSVLLEFDERPEIGIQVEGNLT